MLYELGLYFSLRVELNLDVEEWILALISRELIVVLVLIIFSNPLRELSCELFKINRAVQSSQSRRHILDTAYVNPTK